LISKIADRAVELFAKFSVREKKMNIFMDIDNVHKICPLRLKELLEADDFNFSHDIGGIQRHFNREKLRLENCFVPRFAA
jgi:hypothetical protein